VCRRTEADTRREAAEANHKVEKLGEARKEDKCLIRELKTRELDLLTQLDVLKVRRWCFCRRHRHRRAPPSSSLLLPRQSEIQAERTIALDAQDEARGVELALEAAYGNEDIAVRRCRCGLTLRIQTHLTSLWRVEQAQVARLRLQNERFRERITAMHQEIAADSRDIGVQTDPLKDNRKGKSAKRHSVVGGTWQVAGGAVCVEWSLSMVSVRRSNSVRRGQGFRLPFSPSKGPHPGIWQSNALTAEVLPCVHGVQAGDSAPTPADLTHALCPGMPKAFARLFAHVKTRLRTGPKYCMGRGLLVRTIYQLYRDKIVADTVDDEHGTARASMPTFVYDWFLNKYGLRKLAEQHVCKLLSALLRFKDENIVVFNCARFTLSHRPGVQEELNVYLDMLATLLSLDSPTDPLADIALAELVPKKPQECVWVRYDAYARVIAMVHSQPPTRLFGADSVLSGSTACSRGPWTLHGTQVTRVQDVHEEIVQLVRKV